MVDNLASCRYPVIFFVVALVLLFYVHLNSCSSYVESWVGMLAPQVSTRGRGQLCIDHLVHIQVMPGCSQVRIVLSESRAVFTCRLS